MSNCCGFLPHKKEWRSDQVFQICEISSVLPNKTENQQGCLLELSLEQKDALRTVYTGYCRTEFVGCVDMNYLSYKHETGNNQ
jgi:hypothetical protein